MNLRLTKGLSPVQFQFTLIQCATAAIGKTHCTTAASYQRARIGRSRRSSVPQKTFVSDMEACHKVRSCIRTLIAELSCNSHSPQTFGCTPGVISGPVRKVSHSSH